jgi:hypothetical protein
MDAPRNPALVPGNILARLAIATGKVGRARDLNRRSDLRLAGECCALPQALPEASSGASPSHMIAKDLEGELIAKTAVYTVCTEF